MYFRGSSVQERIREKSSLLKEVPYLLLICVTEVIKKTPYLSTFFDYWWQNFMGTSVLVNVILLVCSFEPSRKTMEKSFRFSD